MYDLPLTLGIVLPSSATVVRARGSGRAKIENGDTLCGVLRCSLSGRRRRSRETNAASPPPPPPPLCRSRARAGASERAASPTASFALALESASTLNLKPSSRFVSSLSSRPVSHVSRGSRCPVRVPSIRETDLCERPKGAGERDDASNRSRRLPIFSTPFNRERDRPRRSRETPRFFDVALYQATLKTAILVADRSVRRFGFGFVKRA